MSFFDIEFWKDVSSNGLATLLGALVGIPIALWLNRLIDSRRQKADKEMIKSQMVERRKQFSAMLVAALQKNAALVAQMKQQLTPNKVIFYNVDNLVLESTSSLKYELIEDLDLNRLLDSIRYELDHIHKKVELQLETVYSSYRAMGGFQKNRTQLIQAIIDHFPRVESELHEAITKLNAIRETD